MSEVVKETPLYRSLGDGKVECLVCERRCVISPGFKGWCKTKANFEGKLYTLVYGDLSAVESRPIEIKPFFHYWPGSTSLTFSTWSCNFDCPWCQNHHLSKVEPKPEMSNYVPPENLVKAAERAGDEGLCVSFNEPLMLFEYSLDVFKLGKSRGLYCCYVSNGYMTLKALNMLIEAGLDGLKIDVKGDQEVYQRYCGGLKADVVWRNAEEAKKRGVHVEIVNLIITNVNDDEECLRWVVENHLKKLGPDTPIHFTRYYPAYRFREPQTKVEVLEKAYFMAKKAGLNYPYLGNVLGHPFEHTYCPNCGEAVIKRYGYSIVSYKLDERNRCLKCGFTIPIAGKFVKKRMRQLFVY